MNRSVTCRLAATFLCLSLGLAPVAAQASNAARVGGLEARLSALAGSAKPSRMIVGGMIPLAGVAAGLVAGNTVGGGEAFMVAGSIMAGSAVAGGLLFFLPSKAEAYYKRFSAMPGGLFGQDEARIAAGEAWLDDLALAGRRGRVTGALAALALSAWGFAGTGWFDSLFPIAGFSTTISPFTGLEDAASISATIGVAAFAVGLICMVLPSAAEDARASYRQAFRLAGAGTPGIQVASAPDCLGVRVRF